MHETLTQSPLGTNNSSSSPSCDLPYDEDRLPLVLLYSVVLAIGLPANLLTIYLTWLQVRRKNVLGIYLWSLSLCDLMYLCTLPMWAYYVNQNHMWPWSGLACKVTGYIFFNNMYISIFLLCCISCDRYVAVVYAVESRGLRRQRLAIIVAAAIVLVVALGHMPVFIMQEGNASDGRCFEPGHSNTVVTGFNYARFVIGFLIPLALLVITNRVILANIQLSSGLRPQQKERVRYLAVAVVALFLVCFAPYHVILLVRAITFHFSQPGPSSCDFEKKIYTPYTISLGLSTFNSAINPILYVLSSDNIQKELVRGLAALHSRATVRPRSTDSSQHKMQHSKNSAETAATSRATEKPGSS
ncbi:LOW QUALITY PROTEIN: putative G-protein coupled receptor 132b [Myripristis murdjan]|uniref:LOW QUALITY PROTEIN: putative G-protein coupled receptor 132b n=1 Tax=Myripristis murdjan TaxID=586833 RepID=UPI0011760AE4|nr:LOW QUALITY PROTEIN: probable G-protein coupled receptor 132 [Myripristis murdjan]